MANPENSEDSMNSCKSQLERFSDFSKEDRLKLCEKAARNDLCLSAEGSPILHFERKSTKESSKRILVFALMHGDEIESGFAALAWLKRLSTIDPRNSWRIIPILNPDGFALNTRTNKNGIDINRNFPTKNWHSEAPAYWAKRSSNNPRRNPGRDPGSEPETKCAMHHVEAFAPDFVISIHTPYGVLDFDGPRIPGKPKTFLPWNSLGTYPGSLGTYLWVEKKVPVLTIELYGSKVFEDLSRYERLQDISSELATSSANASFR